MSRIPLPTSHSHAQVNHPASPTPPPVSMSRPNGGARPARPESIYSSSNLSSHSPSQSGADGLTETRKRQGRRDEAIRKKIESELSRKRPPSKRGPSTPGGGGSSSRSSRPKQGTVSALRPLPALTVPHSISVADASQLCAAKRTDCVLVVDEDEHLCGIFTAKDLAFRVVGDGLDPRSTPVSAIMTPNPMVTRDTTSATEALQTMVTRGFRHLPVCNEEGDVVGLLDITKVFHESLEKLEKSYDSSQKLYSALEGAQEQFGGSGEMANPLMAYVQALRDKMSFPDLGSILDARTAPATVGVKTTVREAAKLMRERRTTAVCVMENEGRKIAGIFTSKDVVLRVIAAGLDAKTCSVVRVMTPHPDTGLPTLSIQDALRKMHNGHYLNLPVVEEDGSLVGIVDVLKLTYATLEQVNSIGADTSSGEPADTAGGPLWSRFFNAVGQTGAPDDDDTESQVSGTHAGTASDVLHTPSRPSHRQQHSMDTPSSEVFPGDSASVVFEQTQQSELSRLPPASSAAGQKGAADTDDGTYLFKFVAPGGTTHRFQARYDSFDFVVDIIRGKLSNDPFFAASSSTTSSLQSSTSSSEDGTLVDPTPPPSQTKGPDPADFQMLYFDDDGDLVLMTADRDLTDAVSVARTQGKDRVVVHLRGGKGWDAELERRGLGAEEVAARKKLRDVGEEAKRVQEALKAVEEEVEVEHEELEEEEAKEDKVKGAKKGSKRRSREDVADELVLGFLRQDQLLPASIGLLAAAIVGVFTLNKVTGGSK